MTANLPERTFQPHDSSTNQNQKGQRKINDAKRDHPHIPSTGAKFQFEHQNRSNNKQSSEALVEDATLIEKNYAKNTLNGKVGGFKKLFSKKTGRKMEYNNTRNKQTGTCRHEDDKFDRENQRKYSMLLQRGKEKTDIKYEEFEEQPPFSLDSGHENTNWSNGRKFTYPIFDNDNDSMMAVNRFWVVYISVLEALVRHFLVFIGGIAATMSYDNIYYPKRDLSLFLSMLQENIITVAVSLVIPYILLLLPFRIYIACYTSPKSFLGNAGKHRGWYSGGLGMPHQSQMIETYEDPNINTSSRSLPFTLPHEENVPALQNYFTTYDRKPPKYDLELPAIRDASMPKKSVLRTRVKLKNLKHGSERRVNVKQLIPDSIQRETMSLASPLPFTIPTKNDWDCHRSLASAALSPSETRNDNDEEWVSDFEWEVSPSGSIDSAAINIDDEVDEDDEVVEKNDSNIKLTRKERRIIRRKRFMKKIGRGRMVTENMANGNSSPLNKYNVNDSEITCCDGMPMTPRHVLSPNNKNDSLPNTEGSKEIFYNNSLNRNKKDVTLKKGKKNLTLKRNLSLPSISQEIQQSSPVKETLTDQGRKRELNPPHSTEGVHDIGSSEFDKLCIFDCNTMSRIIPNSKPVPFDTPMYHGTMLMLLRPENADNNDATQRDPTATYFRGKQRRFEFQFQLSFKQEPTGPLYLGCQVEKPVQMGMIQRVFVGTLLSFVKKMNSGFHYSFGEEISDSDRAKGSYERAHFAFGVEASMDRLVQTTPPEIPPKLGGTLEESPESCKYRKKVGRGSVLWNTTDVYTMSLYSAYLDWTSWQGLNLPGVRPFSMNSVLGAQPITLTVYALKSINSDIENEKKPTNLPQPHYEKDRDLYTCLEFSNLLATKGGVAEEWETKLKTRKNQEEICETVHLTDDQSETIDQTSDEKESSNGDSQESLVEGRMVEVTTLIASSHYVSDNSEYIKNAVDDTCTEDEKDDAAEVDSLVIAHNKDFINKTSIGISSESEPSNKNMKDTKLDVSAWIEIIHRTKRIRMRAYIVRVSQSSGSDMPSQIDDARLVNVTLQEKNSNETEPRNEAQHDKNATTDFVSGLKDMGDEKSKVFTRIRTGRDLSPLLQLGSLPEAPTSEIIEQSDLYQDGKIHVVDETPSLVGNDEDSLCDDSSSCSSVKNTYEDECDSDNDDAAFNLDESSTVKSLNEKGNELVISASTPLRSPLQGISSETPKVCKCSTNEHDFCDELENNSAVDCTRKASNSQGCSVEDFPSYNTSSRKPKWIKQSATGISRVANATGIGRVANATGIGRVAKTVTSRTVNTGKQMKKVTRTTVKASRAIIGMGHVAVNRVMKSRRNPSHNHALVQGKTMAVQQPMDASVQMFSDVLSNLSAKRVSSPSIVDLMSLELAEPSELDEWFLSGGAADLGITPSKRETGKPIYDIIVARGLYESHWREEWVAMYQTHISFYAPMQRNPFKIAFRDIGKIRDVDIPDESSPLPGLFVSIIETSWECYYLAFPSFDTRFTFHQHANRAIYSCDTEEGIIPHPIQPEDEADPMNIEQRASHVSLSRWAPISLSQKAKQRVVLNNRRMTFDTEAWTIKNIDDKAVDETYVVERSIGCFVENLLSRALSFTEYSLAESPHDFILFLDDTSRLRTIPLSCLDFSSVETMCIFVNIYHCLFQHALLLSANGPPTKRSIARFMNCTCYEIGDDVFSLAEIEHCVIRARMSRPANNRVSFVSVPKVSHNHYYYALSTFACDARINFFLNTGATSNLGSVSILSPLTMNEQINAACSKFLDKELTIDSKKRLILLPKICDIYRNDFGNGDSNSCLYFCLQFVNSDKQNAILSLMEGNVAAIKFQNFCDTYHLNLSMEA